MKDLTNLPWSLILIALACLGFLWIFWIEMTKPTNKPKKPRLSARDYLEMLGAFLLAIGLYSGTYILAMLIMIKVFKPAVYKYDPTKVAYY